MICLEFREVGEDHWTATWELSPNSMFVLDAIDSEEPGPAEPLRSDMLNSGVVVIVVLKVP